MSQTKEGSMAEEPKSHFKPEQKYSNCRMYEQKYPEVNDVVFVQVKSLAEMGAYVSLLEYNNIEGMILHSELSRRRIRSVTKLIRVGRNEVVVVLRVDKEKGYIDLSKRRATPEDIANMEIKWNKSKATHSIMRHTAAALKIRLDKLYQDVTWPLYARYGHAYDAFKLLLSEPAKVPEFSAMDDVMRAEFLSQISRRLTPQPIKCRADIELTCFTYAGIDAIQEALRAGLAVSTPEHPMQINLVAPPLYVLTVTSLEKKSGLELLSRACQEVKNSIETKHGDMNIKIQPRAISERDERDLQESLRKLQEEEEE